MLLGYGWKIKYTEKEKMKRKILGVVVASFGILCLASCGEEKANATTTTTPPEVDPGAETRFSKATYTIEVYDIDNALVSEKNIDMETYPTLWEGLNNNFTVVAEDTQYGHLIKSIDGTVIDPNWSLMIYENGIAAENGVDYLTVQAEDVFTFKNECWNTQDFEYGTFDEYDVLVDMAIYKYAKNVLPGKLEAYTSFEKSLPWELLSIYNMAQNGYDTNIFNVDKLTDAYKTSVIQANVADLPNASETPSDANYARWYYAARALGTDLTAFKDAYSTYLEGLTAYSSWGEYTLPFTLSFAKALELDSKIADAVKAPTYRASTEYGPDGLAWQYTGMSVYNEITKETLMKDLAATTLNASYSKSVSLASCILPYAANNISARDVEFAESEDIIEYLFANYYDSDTYQFDLEKSAGDASSNQIYAALMAYKIQRDKKKAVNILA